MAAVRVAAGFDSGFFPTVPGIQKIVSASVAGAVIVFVGATLIISLRHSYQDFLAGAIRIGERTGRWPRMVGPANSKAESRSRTVASGN